MKAGWSYYKRWVLMGLVFSSVYIIDQTFWDEKPLVRYWENWGELNDLVRYSLIERYVQMLCSAPFLFLVIGFFVRVFTKPSTSIPPNP